MPYASSFSSPSSDAESDKKSRRVFDFPIQTLIEYSFLRQDEAARALGVAPITLKRICQRLKYRWPYRMLKAQARREGRRALKPRAQACHSKSPLSALSGISSLFSSPEPEPRANVDVLSSLCVHLPRLQSAPVRRHLELSLEQQEPRSFYRLPPLSSFRASLSRSAHAPIRLPKLFLTRPQQPIDNVSPEPRFPLELEQRQPEAATMQYHGSSPYRSPLLC